MMALDSAGYKVAVNYDMAKYGLPWSPDWNQTLTEYQIASQDFQGAFIVMLLMTVVLFGSFAVERRVER